MAKVGIMSMISDEGFRGKRVKREKNPNGNNRKGETFYEC